MTLVEALVVLAIVGITTGATVLGLGSLGRGARSETEAMRLADRLQLAADEAIATAAPLALVWSAGGYEFVAWDPIGGGWNPSRRRELGRRHDLPAALRLERPGARDKAPILIAPDLPQPPLELRITGGGTEWRVALDGIQSAAQAVER
jgi:general secretion pathway protein H